MRDDLNTAELSWTVHPASEQPVRAMAALLVIGFATGAAYRFSGEMTLSLLSLIVFLVVLIPFFQKTTFRLDDTGVERRLITGRRRLKWAEIRRYTVNPRGIYLTPHPRESWRDFQGVFVMFRGNREQVVAEVQKRLGEI